MELVELPYYREQLRWALACYRHNKQASVPHIRTEMIALFGEDRIERELSPADLYNFLDKGTMTRPFKLKLVEEFLRDQAPNYVRCLAKPDLIPTLADFIERFMMPRDGIANLHDRHLAQGDLLANKTFVCMPNDSPIGGHPQAKRDSLKAKAGWKGFQRTSKMEETRLKETVGRWTFLSCISLRLLSNRRHFQFLAFNVDFDIELLQALLKDNGPIPRHPRQDDVDLHPEWQWQVALNALSENGRLGDHLPIRNLYTGVLVPTASSNEYVGMGKTIDGKVTLLNFAAKQQPFDDAWWISVGSIDSKDLGQRTLDPMDPMEYFMVSSRIQRENTEMRFIDEFVASADWSMS